MTHAGAILQPGKGPNTDKSAAYHCISLYSTFQKGFVLLRKYGLLRWFSGIFSQWILCVMAGARQKLPVNTIVLHAPKKVCYLGLHLLFQLFQLFLAFLYRIYLGGIQMQIILV